MKNNQKLFNYALSIGFIVLIVVFIFSLVVISRAVLSDTNPIRDYVENTRSLLDDVSDVEVQIDDVEGVQIDDRDLLRLKFNNYQENILEVADLNINENKSILTVVLNSKIGVRNNVYYLIVKNSSELNKGYEVVYEDIGGNLEFGKVFSVSGNDLKILNVDSKEILTINVNDILGKVLLKDESKD